MKRAGGRGSNIGGNRGNSGGNSRARSDQPAQTLEASGVICQGREGTPLTNSAHISVLTLRSGENTRDVLRNAALLTLGVVCGVSVGTMGDAASRDVTGREVTSLPRLQHWQQ